MPLRDTLTMFFLAALWGGSFLFLRHASPILGPVPLAGFRTAGAALTLIPLVIWHRQGQALKGQWGALAIAALLSTVLPFLGLSQAARSLPAGLLSILNATTPLWGALVGWYWSGEALGRQRVAGLLMGFVGVALLAADKGNLGAGSLGAMGMALGATLMYAIAVHFNKHHLRGLPPVAVSAGTLAMSGLMLLGPAFWLGPLQVPDTAAPLGTLGVWGAVPHSVWLALAAFALPCTALAYLLFYRLVERIGPTRSLSVTFLIPIFGMLWGALFLGERVSPVMLASTAVIVLGTVLSNRGSAPPAPTQEASAPRTIV
ncbi:DMT family transporter [Aquabacterium sp.]|uniref:DMT family transporter n=1 Tax=Aquabacterium sp. TaxID=1872578 RepID=UPI0025BD9903|nr:DMT family transporter [Aquabacterium sp.]